MKQTFLLLLSLTICLMGQAQISQKIADYKDNSSTLSWTKFTTADGLPSDAIKDI